MPNRRHFCRTAVLGAGVLITGAVRATDFGRTAGLPLQEIVALPWLCNALSTGRDGRLFAGLPRWPGYAKTPSIVEILPGGALKPFPGGAWNTWQPGMPTADALVAVNTIHVFDGKTMWVVDQGAPFLGERVDAYAPKVLQFDLGTGRLLRRIVFGKDVLPAKGSINDLRLDAGHAYFTDSGAGAIIVVDLTTGAMLRRLAGHPSTQAQADRPPLAEGGKIMTKPDGSVVRTHADPIEISPDGRWLYYQTQTGPLYRVPTHLLRDATIDDADLGSHVEYVYDTPTLGGSAMDSLGNIYLSETSRPRISVLTPRGEVRVLAEDDRLWNADALFITADRELLIPVPQTSRLAMYQGPGGTSWVQPPFHLYRVALPAWAGNAMAIPPVSATPSA